ARGESQNRRDQPGTQQCEHRLLDDAVQREQPGGVGAEAKERSMSQRKDAGVAQDQVEGQRKKSQDRDLGQDEMLSRQQEHRRERKGPEDVIGGTPAPATREMLPHVLGERSERRAVAHRRPPRTSNPYGRKISITIMT